MKAAFKRARPALYINGDEKTIDFFSEQTRDYSFPSAHTAFYFSFFLPFALPFKRYLPLILFIPAVIAIGMVVQNDHYLSDVLCSILIVFNICLLTYWVLNFIDNTSVNFKTKRMERRKGVVN